MNLVLEAQSKDELNTLSPRLYINYKVQRTILSIDLADPSSSSRCTPGSPRVCWMRCVPFSS